MEAEGVGRPDFLSSRNLTQVSQHQRAPKPGSELPWSSPAWTHHHEVVIKEISLPASVSSSAKGVDGSSPAPHRPGGHRDPPPKGAKWG